MAEAIWAGSGSAVSGTTPFGFYDDDSTYQSEAPKFATWAAKRLGYPISSVDWSRLRGVESSVTL